ncbi:MAG: hypothetical protein R2865_09150 [Deinococcales bacterium]
MTFISSLVLAFGLADEVVTVEAGSQAWLQSGLSSRLSMSGIVLGFGINNSLAEGIHSRFDIGFYPVSHAELAGFNLPVTAAVQSLELSFSAMVRGGSEGSFQLYSALGPRLFLGFAEQGMGVALGVGALGGFEWPLGQSQFFVELEGTLPFLQAQPGQNIGFSLNFLPRISLGLSEPVIK